MVKINVVKVLVFIKVKWLTIEAQGTESLWLEMYSCIVLKFFVKQ